MEILNNQIQPWHLESIGQKDLPHYDSFKGKPLLILFFYLGCPGCVGRAIPFATKLAYEHGDKMNVLGIHSNFEGPEYTNDEIIENLKSLHVRFPVFRDAGMATTFHDYQAGGTPHWVLVDKNGKVVRSIFGSDPNRALLWLDYAIIEELEK